MIDWEDLVLETAERFGGTMPHPDTANAIATVYAKAPQAVQREIDRAAADYQDGAIRSPWGILRTRVQQITLTSKANTRANNDEKAVARAEQWIRNAGLHYDLESEVLDELYGDRGTLRDHPETRDRMLELWRSLRPLGELVEHEQAERLQRWADQNPQHRTTGKYEPLPVKAPQ